LNNVAGSSKYNFFTGSKVYSMSAKNTQPQQPVSQHGCLCPYCQRRFDTTDELTLHIVTRHTQLGIKRGPAQAGSGAK
jgi:hypothetical protein